MPGPARAYDDCGIAEPAALGDELLVDLSAATADGASTCDGPDRPDVWFRWLAPNAEAVYVLGADRDDIELSVHSGCPGTVDNQVTCGARNYVSSDIMGVDFEPIAGQTYYLRVAAKDPQAPPADLYSLSFTPGGVIEGVVTDNEGQPLPNIKVSAGDSNNFILTDADGRYRFGGLGYESRFVFAGFDSDYVTEFFDDVSCPNFVCFGGRTVVFAAPGTVATADFALEPAASIAGTVTDDISGEALPNQSVRLFGQAGDTVQFLIGTSTDEEGRYRLAGLAAGSYTLEAGGSSGYVREYWDDVPCIPATCSPELGAPVVVDGGEAVDGIDFGLRQGLTIGGVLREAETDRTLGSTLVHLRDVEGELLETTLTNSFGRYLFDGLAIGPYRVNSASIFYINEVWPDVPCAYGPDCPAGGGTIIELPFVSGAGIDFALEPGGVLSASIRSEENGAMIAEAGVAVYTPAGELLTAFLDSGTGVAEVPGLPTGEYRAIGFKGDGSFASELYDGFDCPVGPDTCGSIADGTPINITKGESTPIDMTLRQLGPTCQPGLARLCLNEGRFAVTARWRRPSGGEGVGFASRFSGIDDSGAFYFFDPQNTELVVKVLDACGEPFDRFWVFVAGLTNVEVELTVEDTLVGGVRTYVNPLGTAFEPIQDTDAFATCIAAGVGPPGAVNPQTEPANVAAAPQATAMLAEIDRRLDAERRRSEHQLIEAERQEAASGTPIAKAECIPTTTALCLGAGGRFQVEASWRIPGGDEGHGVAIPFREDTGLFWFFDSSNVEVIVKVLDACAEPFDRFWVFASGLTNVEVQLRVTDTATGEVRVYDNPQGQRFQPIQDTQAFDTCP